MNKTIALLAITGLSLAHGATDNQIGNLSDNELGKFSDFTDKVRGGIKKAAQYIAENPEQVTRVAQFIANKADQEDDEQLGKLEDIFKWGYNNRHALKDAVKIIKRDDEEDLDDDALGFKDTLNKGKEAIKKGIKKAAKYVAENPEQVTRIAQFISNKLDKSADNELGKVEDLVKWGFDNRHALKDLVKTIKRDDEENLDDELGFRDTIKKGIKKVANYVAENPEKVSKVAQFISNKLDQEADEELGFKDTVRETATTIRNNVRQALADTKAKIRKGAEWVHNKVHPHHNKEAVEVTEVTVQDAEVETNAEEELNDDALGFKDTLKKGKEAIKKGIKKAAKYIAENPEKVTRVAQFISKKLEKESDNELGIKDTIKQAVADTKAKIQKGANWIHNKFHPHPTPAKVEEVETNSEDAELVYRPLFHKLPQIRPRVADDLVTFDGEDVLIGF